MPEVEDRRESNPGLDASILRRVAAEVEEKFPLVIRRTGLVLFDVDPGHLQAQWQVEKGQLEQLRSAFPSGATGVHVQLRLLRPGAPAEERLAQVYTPETSAPENEGVARFSVRDHGTLYQAELGLASEEGGWLLLARSNQVLLPRPVGRPIPPRPDPRDPVSARTVPEPGPALPPLQSEQPVVEEPEPDTLSPAPVPQLDTLPPAPVPQLDGEPDPARRIPAIPFDPTLADSGARLPPVFPRPGATTVWSPVTPIPRVITVLAKLAPGLVSVPLPVTTGLPPSGAETSAGSPRPPRPSEPSYSPADAEASPPIRQRTEDGGWPLPVFAPYDPLSAATSHASSQPWPETAQRRTGLEVHAELLLYGWAEPGRLIRLFGQSLRVGPNGRFFRRRPLGDSLLPSTTLAELITTEASGPETQ